MDGTACGDPDYANVITTSDGGAIVSVESVYGGAAAQKVAGVSPNGEVRWSRVISASDNVRHLAYMHGTADGGALLAYDHFIRCTDGSVACLATSIEIIDAATGQTKQVVARLGDAASDIKHAGIPVNGSGKEVAFTTGRIYAKLGLLRADSTRQDALAAIDTSAISAMYPEAAVLGQDTPGPPTTTTTTTTTTTITTTLPPPARPKLTAVLGDSFASGEGVPPFEKGTDVPKPASKRNVCHRSLDAAAHVLDRIGRIKLAKFVACSGATTANVLDAAQYVTQRAQVTALSPSIEQVIITIGGNDAEFDVLATSCVTIGCTQLKERIDLDLFVLFRASLPRVLAQIRKRVSTETEILVLGYPQVIADPDQYDISQCKAIRAKPFPQPTADDIRFGRSVGSSLNAGIEKVVSNTPGAKFVDVSPEFEGHQLCGPKRSFFNGIVSGHKEFSLHPNDDGQRAYARAIIRAMNSA
jgi:hypothetical protein